jgi:hypothetical protein
MTYPVTVLSTSTALVPNVYVASSVSSYQTSSVSEQPITEQTSTNEQVLDIGQLILKPNYYEYSSNYLNVGSDVQVSWTTDNHVDAYVFNSAEYNSYAASGTTSPNIASQTNTGSGTLAFQVLIADTYYFVLHNPNTGFLGFLTENDTVSASGSATFQTETTVYVAQTNTYIASTTLYTTLTSTSTSTTVLTQTTQSISTQYVTQTGESTTTDSCSYSILTYLLGSNKCG